MATTEHHFPVTATAMFDILVDPLAYPRWLVGARRIRSVSEDWPQVASTFWHEVGFGPLRIRDSTTVLAVDPPQMLELLVRARPALEAVVRFEVAAAVDGCLVRMIETPTGIHRLISTVAQPLIAARNARSMQRLDDEVVRRQKGTGVGSG